MFEFLPGQLKWEDVRAFLSKPETRAVWYALACFLMGIASVITLQNKKR